MSINNNTKSLFNHFSKYTEELVLYVVDLVKHTSKYDILISEYGPNLDGNGKKNLSYLDKVKLENLLRTMEEKLEMMDKIINNDFPFDKLKSILEHKTDTEIMDILKNACNNQIETKEQIPLEEVKVEEPLIFMPTLIMSDETIIELEQAIGEYHKKEDKIPFFDKIILDTYAKYMDQQQVKEKLAINDSTLIKSELKYLEFYPMPENIISYILSRYPNKLEDILECEYMKDKVSLTEKEKKYIYLKLVQRKTKSLTDEDIAKIMGVDVSDFTDYEIMTKEDSINKINEYIKK